MIFYTADLHLSHEAIIRYCGRPFETVEEMNETIVNNWNAVVSKKEEVFDRRCAVQAENRFAAVP